jgi:hypothetical protein
VVLSRAALRRFPFAHRNRNFSSKFVFVNPLSNLSSRNALRKDLEIREITKSTKFYFLARKQQAIFASSTTKDHMFSGLDGHSMGYTSSSGRTASDTAGILGFARSSARRWHERQVTQMGLRRTVLLVTRAGMNIARSSREAVRSVRRTGTWSAVLGMPVLAEVSGGSLSVALPRGQEAMQGGTDDLTNSSRESQISTSGSTPFTMRWKRAGCRYLVLPEDHAGRRIDQARRMDKP